MERERELGRKLTEAGADRGKIAGMALLRALFVGVFVVIGARSGGLPLAALLLIPAVLIAGWPLLHLRDTVAFYENGMCYRGKPWLFSELGSLGWRQSRVGADLFTRTYLDVGTKRFDFTYIKGGKSACNKAYLKQI